MTGTFAGRNPPLVVDLRRRDVPVPEELLDLGNVHPGIQKQSGGGGTKGVGRVDTLAWALSQVNGTKTRFSPKRQESRNLSTDARHLSPQRLSTDLKLD